MKKNTTNNEMWDDDEFQSEDSLEKVVLLDLIVDKGQELLRIDKFLLHRIPDTTRNKIQQAIDDGLVLVNQKMIKSNYKIKPNDHLIVYDYQQYTSTEIIPEDIPLDIVFEDEDIIIINKPYGMVVHPGHGNHSGTLVNAVAFHLLKNDPNKELLPRVGLVHRIDKDTSGLLVIGKTERALLCLSEQFMNHTVKRKYQALVWGDVENDEGTIRTYIGRHERFRKLFAVYHDDDEKGKHAVTHYKVLERFNYVTLIECQLETGRTHQIRVHMKYIGHTLFNDLMYGGDKILKGTIFSKYKAFVENCFELCPRQALHAKTLGFIHPSSGKEILFDRPLPIEMERMIEKWKTYIKAKGII